MISALFRKKTNEEASVVSETPKTTNNPGLITDKLSLSDFDFFPTVGTGTFGRVRVVKLKNKTDSPPMALKMLKKSEVIRLKQVEHVRYERDILLKVKHPFIVTLHATFQDSKRLFMLMEYVNGGELFSYLRREARVSVDCARFFAAEIVLAFEYLHSLNIVYRDLKPENILIDNRGHLKLTDFGFAKVVEDRTWTLCGTPEYLAPEIIASKGHGKGVDWWALGVLIFEMLAGYPPFYDESPFGIYQKVRVGIVDYPRNMDPWAREIISGLLVADRARRLGCLKDGAADVKRARFFRGVDWAVAAERGLTPTYLPPVTSAEDTMQFDRYPESMEEDAPEIEADLFAGF
jgi:protein kinase X